MIKSTPSFKCKRDFKRKFQPSDFWSKWNGFQCFFSNTFMIEDQTTAKALSTSFQTQNNTDSLSHIHIHTFANKNGNKNKNNCKKRE